MGHFLHTEDSYTCSAIRIDFLESKALDQNTFLSVFPNILMAFQVS